MEFRSCVQRSFGWDATVERPQNLLKNLYLRLHQIKELVAGLENLKFSILFKYLNDRLLVVFQDVVGGSGVCEYEPGCSIPCDVGGHGQFQVSTLDILHDIIGDEFSDTAHCDKNLALTDRFASFSTSLQQKFHRTNGIEAHP